MSIFAFAVKNVFFCLDLFHEISPFYDLFIPIFSILFIILLLEHTEYEKMCTAPLRDYRRLAVISVYFSVFGCWSAVHSCLLATLVTQLFCCICCKSRCLNIFVRNTATLWTVYLSVFSLLKGRSEEHTSELQSHLNLVCRPLREKKPSGFSCLWPTPTSIHLTRASVGMRDR